jgi:predicted trehalose synthase
VSDSPLLCYIVMGQRVGLGCNKVLVPNPEYKGKGRTELASSNLTLRVQRRRLPPKINAPPETMEFSDDDMEEEKEELSNELVASLKQKITALEEQVTELHLAVYDQQDDFGVLRKATMSKLKRFTKALGDLSLYNAPSP